MSTHPLETSDVAYISHLPMLYAVQSRSTVRTEINGFGSSSCGSTNRSAQSPAPPIAMPARPIKIR